MRDEYKYRGRTETDFPNPILVTGSSGFIGSRLCQILKRMGCTFFEYDKTNNQDVLDASKLHEYLSASKAVVHLASPSSALMFSEHPEESMDTAIKGLKNIVEQWRGPLVFPSTCTLYGSSSVPVKEEAILPKAPNLYAESKKRCEAICLESITRGISPRILRIFSGYGPGEKRKGIYASPLYRFVQSAVNAQSPVIFGDGSQVRDFIYIDDIVDAIIRALRFTGREVICNVGTGKGLSFNFIISYMKHLYPDIEAPRYNAAPKGYVPSIVADINFAKRCLGFSPSVTYEAGIAKLIASLKHNDSSPGGDR